MKSNMPTRAPRIIFDRTSSHCYDVFYDGKVLVGNLVWKGQQWVFLPCDESGLGTYTMKAIIEKIEWLETRMD
jgi:hypothetical protein